MTNITEPEAEPEEEYEIEKILDHISFNDAFERVYKFKDNRYESIFSSGRIIRSKKVHTVSKYFFLVKWLGYDRKSATWEPETNIPDGVYLAEYKKLNALTMPHVTLKVSLKFKTGTRNYEAPVVINEIVDRRPRVQFARMEEMSISLNDNIDNGQFGMVPVSDYKKKSGQNVEYLKKGKEVYLMKHTVFHKSVRNDTENRVKKHHQGNRSYLQSLISHANIVRMKDSFYSCDAIQKTVTITSIYEWCAQSLRQKVHKDGADWKKVCRDILSALAFVHPNGIHQGVSIDNIYCHKNGNFKLSHFNDFVFTNAINAKNVKSGGVELAPRKFGLLEQFDATLDIYALAIVLLQCQDKEIVFRANPASVTEIEEDIDKAMAALETDEDRHFIKMMLKARQHIHYGSGKYRFDAHSLLMHPVPQGQPLKSVECFYMHSMLSFPIKERVFYDDEDSVEDVIYRLLSLYHGTENNPSSMYFMLLADDFSVRESALLVNNNEKFGDVVRNDVTSQKKELMISPIIKPLNTAKREPEKFIVLYEQELGGCPIVVETPRMDDVEFAKMIKREAVSEEHRKLRLHMFPKLPSEDSDDENIVKYTENEYLMKLVEKNGAAVENRFASSKKMNEPLNGQLLKWKDVAGIEKLQKISAKMPKKAGKKRPHGSASDVVLPSNVNQKRVRSNDAGEEQELPNVVHN